MDLISAVRLEIGDTNPEKGILPNNRPFADNEIMYAAQTEGVTELPAPTDRDIGRVSARCLEIASQSWASQPEELELGPSAEKGKRDQALGKKAATLRAIWGYGNEERANTSSFRPPNYVGVGFNYLPPGVG